MLKTILSISGKPGLYKLISQGKNILYVESFTDKKRFPVHARDKVVSLGDIAIYTDAEDTPLSIVLESVKEKENGAKASVSSNASADELRAYMTEVLPGFDRDRVYPGDIKKLINWYNLLTEAGVTDFSKKEEEESITN
jgi:hypothetical protein